MGIPPRSTLHRWRLEVSSSTSSQFCRSEVPRADGVSAPGAHGPTPICPQVGVFSGGPAQESTCKHIQVIGQIQLLAYVGPRAPFPCCWQLRPLFGPLHCLLSSSPGPLHPQTSGVTWLVTPISVNLSDFLSVGSRKMLLLKGLV